MIERDGEKIKYVVKRKRVRENTERNWIQRGRERENVHKIHSEVAVSRQNM